MSGPAPAQAPPPCGSQDPLRALQTAFNRIQILETTMQQQADRNRHIEAQVTIQRQQLDTAERLLTEASKASTQQHSQINELTEALRSQLTAQQDLSTAVAAMMTRTERGSTPTEAA